MTCHRRLDPRKDLFLGNEFWRLGMATSKESRTAFYKEARKQLATLKKRPKLKRKRLIRVLAFLLEGTMLILEEREPNEQVSKKA
jgi:hypothetical protein